MIVEFVRKFFKVDEISLEDSSGEAQSLTASPSGELVTSDRQQAIVQASILLELQRIRTILADAYDYDDITKERIRE